MAGQINSQEKTEITILKSEKAFFERRLRNFKFNWVTAITVVIIFGALLYGYYAWKTRTSPNFQPAIPYIIFGGSLGMFLYFSVIFVVRRITLSQLHQIDYRLSQLGIEELKENIEEEFFTKLVKLNFTYLDRYYLQTQEQAEKSFWLSVIVSIFGFSIIIAGILILYYRENNSEKMAGYVTTGAGLLSQFISAVFFYLYNKTILKMSQYHQKLVLTQNISLALKITDGMDKELKAKSLEILIDRLTTDINKYLADYKE